MGYSLSRSISRLGVPPCTGSRRSPQWNFPLLRALQAGAIRPQADLQALRFVQTRREMRSKRQLLEAWKEGEGVRQGRRLA